MPEISDEEGDEDDPNGVACVCTLDERRVVKEVLLKYAVSRNAEILNEHGADGYSMTAALETAQRSFL